MPFLSEPKIVFLAVLVILAAALFLIMSAQLKRTVVTLSAGKKEVRVSAEIADSPVTQARGLMFRNQLGENEGMIFVFGGEAPRSFWMMNTYIPLDLIFAAKNGTIVDIKENFEPCTQEFSCPRYVSKPAAYVLEVNAGFVAKNNIRIGGTMRIG